MLIMRAGNGLGEQHPKNRHLGFRDIAAAHDGSNQT